LPLSDHDAQILSLPDTTTPNNGNELYTYREINAYSLNEFQINLSHEVWENVSNSNDMDTNTTFNNFLDTFLETFNASFPKKKTKLKQDNKNWLTTGIKTSCNTKRKLYRLCKESNYPNLKKHYKEYCKLRTKVITLAKKLRYSDKLTNSTNKPKTTWNIIKTITYNQNKPNKRLLMEIEGKFTTHHQTIAEKFNTYYISAADNITNNNQTMNTFDNSHKKDPLNYLYSAFQQSFTSIKLKNTTTGEIEKITTQLKHKTHVDMTK
jgi:hypothetical protein